MSIRIMSKVWEFYPGGGTELLSLLALADWSDDDGRCYPSIASIAKKIRLKERQAQRLVHKLIADGYVHVTGNALGGVPGSTRQYRLNISRLTGVAHDTPIKGTGVTHDVDGCHMTPYTGVTHDTLTTIEPSLTTNAHFAQFWSAYPKKKSKGDAEKAFRALKVDDALMAKILSALDAAKQSKDWQRDNGQFIPYPARWLRTRGWEDEVETSGAGAKGTEWEGAV
jgi:hypothetical protein